MSTLETQTQSDGIEMPLMTVEDVDSMTSNPINRNFLSAAIDNCTQEHEIFMIRFNGLRTTLNDPNATDDQVRKAYTTLKRAMTDFRVALKTIPGKL